MPVGASTDDRRHGFLDGTTLFYRQNDTIATATLTSADPTLAGSWTTPTTTLAPDATPYASAANGAILTLGQPTIAHLADGTEELYFVYGMVTATGANFNIGRVTKR